MDKKIFYLPLTILIFFLVGYTFNEFFYQPYQKEIFKINLETKKIHAEEKILSDFKNRHKNFDNFVELVDSNFYSAKNYLPENSQADIFVNEIYKIAEKNRVKINSVQVGDISNFDSEKVQQQNISLKLSAEYVQILNFIRELLDGERLTNLENFSIEPTDIKNLLTCEITFVIYSTQIE